jgi:hypothetical protein
MMTNLFPPLDEATAQIMIPLPDGIVVEPEDGILFRYDIDHKLIGACQLDDYPDPDGIRIGRSNTFASLPSLGRGSSDERSNLLSRHERVDAGPDSSERPRRRE